MDERFELLPDSVKQAIQGLKDLHNTPDSMAIVCVLSVMNLAACRYYNVDSARYGIRPINEFFVNLAPTGARKSTNFAEVMTGVKNYEKFKQDALRDETVRYVMEEKIYKKLLKQYEKDVEEGLSPRVPPRPKPVETARYQLKTGTRNGIIDMLKSQAFLGLFSSEAGEFFSAHSFQQAASAAEMGTFLTGLWDGEHITKQTGMDSALLRQRRVVLSFLLQSEVFEAIMNNALFSEQGLMHRILITQSERSELRDWDISAEAQEADLRARARLTVFNETICTIMMQEPRMSEDGYFELEPETITQSQAALCLLSDYYNASQGRELGELKNFAGFAHRLHEHALRLAATVAAYEGSTSISETHAACGINLVEYFVEQRRRLELGVADFDANRSLGANRLLSWIEEKTWRGTRRDLQQFGPGWYRKLSAPQRNQMLGDLLNDEVLQMQEIKATNGKTMEVFSCV